MSNSQLSRLGELQESKQDRQNLPWLGIGCDDVSPPCASPHGKHCADRCDRAVHIQRARNDAVHVRSFRSAQNAIDSAQQLADRDGQRANRRWGDKMRRQVRASEAVPPIVTACLEYVHHFAYLLVLEKATNELGAGIFPLLVTFVARQEHLRLDANQASGHLEVVGCLVEPERRDPIEKLFGYPRDRDVVDVDLLVADEREEKIEWSRELRQLDDKDLVPVPEAADVVIGPRLEPQVVHGLGMRYG